MAITYEEALSTLESMFGDPWTRETLDLVLRHHQGHMENTVDEILRYGNDKDPNALIQQLQSGVDTAQLAVERDEQLARQLQVAYEQQPTRRGGGSSSSRPATTESSSPLPPDFLRVPGYPHPSLSSASSHAGGAMMDDAALARMLQDELFSQELARNPDFAHLAGGRVPRGRASSATSGSNRAQTVEEWFGQTKNRLMGTGSEGPPRGGRTANAYEHNAGGGGGMPNILGKLSELGDTAKRRLQFMAAQFNAHQNQQAAAGRSSKNISLAGSDDLALSSSAAAAPAFAVSPTERRGLLDDVDDDDMELAARKAL
jgi:hypothetical protein